MFKKNIFKRRLSLLTSLSFLSAVLISTTACSKLPDKTVNPFWSSFEQNDPKAEDNQKYSPTSGISNLSTTTSSGPISGYNLNAHTNDLRGYGFNGLKTFYYEAQANPDQEIFFENLIYDNLHIKVGKNTELSYKIFPTLGDENLPNVNQRYLSSYIAIDLIYTNKENDRDPRRLSLDSRAIDQDGIHMDAYNQGLSKTLYCNQWNSKHVNMSFLSGKWIKKILLTFHTSTSAELPISGYIDDLSIADASIIDKSSILNYVDTRRGTNTYNTWNQDGKQFSRGLCVPYATIPNGFNLYTPFTTSGDYNWIYTYASDNSELNNLPLFTGIGFSHEPSPWMGDRNSFAVMPGIVNSIADSQIGNVANRGIEFKHENEIARPNYYSVLLDNKIKCEISPGDHSAIFRFTFPNDTNFGSLVFDSGKNNGQYADKYWFGSQPNNNLMAKNEFAGYLDYGVLENSERKNGGSRMFIYGSFSNDNYQIHECSDDSQRNNLNFDLANNKMLEMKFATSYISVDQAKNNLHQEIINQNYNFENLQQATTKLWEQRLSAIDISKSNATQTEKQNLYESLYRLNIYPNKYFENIGTTNQPVYYHASPVLPLVGQITDEETNAQIKPGKMYVTNGFWDTYRTVWPLYQLLYPNLTKELIEGFLLQYQEGGWIARWSAPGYANMMNGTSSDAAFADAYTSGVIKDPNTILDIYNAVIKNATVVSNNSAYGRKYLNQSLYLGYTPAPEDDSEETLAWTVENHINNYAISQLANKLASDTTISDSLIWSKTNQTREQIKSIADYFYHDAMGYVLNFDEEIGFFRGKKNDGDWAHQTEPAPNFYNPLNWYYENTEASGWNYAFSVPYDVQGLIDIYGGQNAFINKLDEYFITTEDGKHYGNRGAASLEMFEARDTRWGQFSFSNQPSHHIPYMYAMAGRPAKTESITHETLNRLYVGADIGQGYCGDEDNGEMSAWYILSSLGLYVLAHGSGQYVLTSPLFDRISINRDNGNVIYINSENSSRQNIFIKNANVDNTPINDAYLNQSTILEGNHTINFDLTNDANTSWATKTISGATPTPINDVTGVTSDWTSSPSGISLDNLFDKDANSNVSFDANNVSLICDRSNMSNEHVNQFILTSGVDNQLFTKIIVAGRDEETQEWNELAQWNDQNFQYAQQSKIFAINLDIIYKYYKIDIVGTQSINLAEISLLNFSNK